MSPQVTSNWANQPSQFAHGCPALPVECFMSRNPCFQLKTPLAVGSWTFPLGSQSPPLCAVNAPSLQKIMGVIPSARRVWSDVILETRNILYGKAPTHPNGLGREPEGPPPDHSPPPGASVPRRVMMAPLSVVTPMAAGPIDLNDYLASLLILVLRPKVMTPQFTGQISLSLPSYGL